MTVTINLPLPPSVNRIWRKNSKSRGGVYRAPQYLAWLKEAWADLRQQKPGKVAGPYILTVLAGRPDNRKRDIGNIEKALSDFLQGQGIVEDDALAVSVRLEWADAAEPGRIHVVITPALEPIQGARLSIKKRAA